MIKVTPLSLIAHTLFFKANYVYSSFQIQNFLCYCGVAEVEVHLVMRPMTHLRALYEFCFRCQTISRNRFFFGRAKKNLLRDRIEEYIFEHPEQQLTDDVVSSADTPHLGIVTVRLEGDLAYGW